ncbi:MAG: hypothetical protein Q9166_002309 [cf. Caloplaca sp. 2 TL-2023]
MASTESSVEKEYMQYIMNRTFQESTRLHMQNCMFTECFGYILHPAIRPLTPPLSVIDVGCSNGHWLLDLADNVPSVWTFHGFVIAGDNFPAKEYLPKNVTFSLHDVFADAPEELVGKFDVVHIRPFGLIAKSGDPTHLCANLIRMLKPGGFLQWDEVDAHRAFFLAQNPTISTQFTDKMSTLWRDVCASLGLTLQWPGNISPIFSDNHRLDIVAAHRYGPINKLRKPTTDGWIMAIDQMLCGIMRRGDKFAKLVEPESYYQMMKGVAEEVTWVSRSA